MVDYFKILDINYNADLNTIKSAFREKVKLLHPDTGIYDESQFALLVEAYKTLSNKITKKTYFFKLSQIIKKKLNPNLQEIPYQRIIFPNRLDIILKRIKVFDKKRYSEISNDFKEDIFLLIKPKEVGGGVYFFIDLPIRRVCPECYGNKQYCHLCEGVGLINSSSKFKVKINLPKNGFLYEIKVDQKPFKGAYFIPKTLKVRILIMKTRKKSITNK